MVKRDIAQQRMCGNWAFLWINKKGGLEISQMVDSGSRKSAKLRKSGIMYLDDL